jgi:Spy/CpxP family protein refolding chaperone
MKESTNNFNSRKFTVIARLALLVLLLTAGGGAAVVRAQDDADEPTPEARRGGGGLLRALNLTPEQRRQIRAIRRETEPQGRRLGMRLMQARLALDEAIYADNPDESVIEERVREVGAAQSAVLRMRALTELKIRRVLTSEQLNAFRRLQRRPRRLQQQQQRMNQTPPPGGFPGDGVITPEERRNRRQRRQREQP